MNLKARSKLIEIYGSQRNLGREFGYNYSRISNWFSGRIRVPDTIAYRINQLHPEISIDDLMS